MRTRSQFRGDGNHPETLRPITASRRNRDGVTAAHRRRIPALQPCGTQVIVLLPMLDIALCSPEVV